MYSQANTVRNNVSVVIMLIITTGTLMLINPMLTYAQQQANFTAQLSGKNITPPVNSPASGTAKFHLNSKRTLSYEVDVSNIHGIIGAHISTKNGTELADLINPYKTVNHQPVLPTGQVNGMLSSGIITNNKLFGPLFGKNVTDLVNIIKNQSAYVIVRTTQHQSGEIQGQIVPST